MAESLMHEVKFECNWKRNTDGSDGTHMEFEVKVRPGEPYKETAKQYSVGADEKRKSRVLKAEYLKPCQLYSGDVPSWTKYHIWAKTEDLAEAKRIGKEHFKGIYESFARDSQEGLASILAYDPEADNG